MNTYLASLAFFVSPTAVSVGCVIALGIIASSCLVSPRRRPLAPPCFSSDILRAVAKAGAAGKSSEHRSAVRRAGNPIAVQLTDVECHGSPKAGLVVDRSTRGLGLALDRPLIVNTLLNVRAANAPAGTGWVKLRVRNCRRIKGRYRVGAEFVQTPPWSVLLLFG